MFEALMRRPASSYRLNAQDGLNALPHHSDVPAYGLSRDFHWIPYSPSESPVLAHLDRFAPTVPEVRKAGIAERPLNPPIPVRACLRVLADPAS
jgi:hypothetical protein